MQYTFTIYYKFTITIIFSDLLWSLQRGHGLQSGYDYFQNRTRHVGDTGNIISTDANGWTKIDVEDSMANMHFGHQNSILYRTVVIHQLEDFGRSPIGPRIACGIIWPGILTVNYPRIFNFKFILSLWWCSLEYSMLLRCS